MEQDHLKLFYDQETLRKTVENYFISTLDSLVLERAYKSGDVTGFKEAKEVIRVAFSKLNEKYAKQDQNKNKDNKAR